MIIHEVIILPQSVLSNSSILIDKLSFSMSLMIFKETNVVMTMLEDDSSITIHCIILKLTFLDLVSLSINFSLDTSSNSIHSISFLLTIIHAKFIFPLFVNQILAEVNRIILMNFVQVQQT